MNRRPTSSQPHHRPIADILQDPGTKWADIREAMKTHGRGSSIEGKKFATATTNAVIVNAFRKYVSLEMISASSPVAVATHDEDGEMDQTDDRKERFTKEINLSEAECSVRAMGGKLTHHSGKIEGANSTKSSGSSAPKSAHDVGSSNIEESTFAKSMEQTTKEGEGDSWNDAKIEDGKNYESRGAPPVRPFARRSSATGGSFRNRSLRNATEDADANMDDWDNSSIESTPDDYTIVDCLPGRRLVLDNSAKGGFRRNLKNVMEDAEADMGALEAPTSIYRKNGQAGADTRQRRGQARPLARHLRTGSLDKASFRMNRRGSLDKGSFRIKRRGSLDKGSFRMNSERPLCLFHSNTSASSIDSVNIMDFGVDHQRRLFSESTLPLSVSSNTSESDNLSHLVDTSGFLAWDNDLSSSSLTGSINPPPTLKREPPKSSELSVLSVDISYNTNTSGSLSNLVDSSGFLSWANDSSSSSLTRSNCLPPASKKEPLKRSESLDTISSSLSNLVDSMGFLGWERRIGDDIYRDLRATASFDGAATIDGQKGEKYSVSQDDISEDSSADNSWRIEDHEDANDMIDVSNRSGSSHILSNQLRRLGNKVNKSMVAMTKKSDVQKDTIKTDDVKRFLLEGHPTNVHLSKGGKARGNEADSSDRYLRNSSFKTILECKRGELLGNSDDRPFSNSSMRTFLECKRRENFDNSAHEHLRNSSWPFFGSRMQGSDVSASDLEDKYYSRPAIRISRGDDTDIGKLRRELCKAGINKGGDTKSKLMKWVSADF